MKRDQDRQITLDEIDLLLLVAMVVLGAVLLGSLPDVVWRSCLGMVSHVRKVPYWGWTIVGATLSVGLAWIRTRLPEGATLGIALDGVELLRWAGIAVLAIVVVVALYFFVSGGWHSVWRLFLIVVDVRGWSHWVWTGIGVAAIGILAWLRKRCE